MFVDDVLLFAKAIEDPWILSSRAFILSTRHRVKELAFQNSKSISLLTSPLQRSNGCLGCWAFHQRKILVNTLAVIHKGKSNALSRSMMERAKEKIAGCKLRCLSKAYRLTLAASVFSSLPICQMQLVKISDRTCKELDILSRSCFGVRNLIRGKIHSISWDTVCRPKAKGGLRLQRFRDFNKALLAKLLWRLHTESSTLWLDC